MKMLIRSSGLVHGGLEITRLLHFLVPLHLLHHLLYGQLLVFKLILQLLNGGPLIIVLFVAMGDLAALVCGLVMGIRIVLRLLGCDAAKRT